ncbi:MAG TPA: DNA helicase [Desulfobulbus sp.]|nr:DNA helicase [Desulfobulbus sp.]
MADTITRFYQEQLPDGRLKHNILTTTCPFCKEKQTKNRGNLIVFLNRASYFHGYFRCSKRCVPGGFPLHFGRLKKLPLNQVPGYDPDRDYGMHQGEYPAKNINSDILGFMEKMTDRLVDRFSGMGVGRDVLQEMKVGFNGRYLVYPYIQSDGNCYSARCVHPDKPEDSFWYGNEDFYRPPYTLWNNSDIECCENGSLAITEGEENLLILKQLGLPCISLPVIGELEMLDPKQMQWLSTLFLFVNHNPESETAARLFAERVGYKIRIIHWPEESPNKYTITDLAREKGDAFAATAFAMIKSARSFSPFGSPEHEHIRFLEQLQLESADVFSAMQANFPKLNSSLDGIHGINIMGGVPKAGKSNFFIQIASDMAAKEIPVIYYDFENGRQKIYMRTLSRLSRLTTEQIKTGTLNENEQQQLEQAQKKLKNMLPWFRVVNERRLSPELMRRHIDFLRHETRSEYTLVVIDSLHKLPFKDLSKRRTGINAWLRQLEAIRDELGVSFLVISELSRAEDGQYDKQPHMGSFKGSGDIEYSADNAMILLPRWDPFDATPPEKRRNDLWLVASREQSPGLIASYRLDFPYWGFVEEKESVERQE